MKSVLLKLMKTSERVVEMLTSYLIGKKWYPYCSDFFFVFIIRWKFSRIITKTDSFFWRSHIYKTKGTKTCRIYKNNYTISNCNLREWNFRKQNRWVRIFMAAQPPSWVLISEETRNIFYWRGEPVYSTSLPALGKLCHGSFCAKFCGSFFSKRSLKTFITLVSTWLSKGLANVQILKAPCQT